MTTQLEKASPVTSSLVISANDPFTTLSQVVKHGSLLVVTPSSILVFATQVPDVELSPDKGSDEVHEDSDDEPIVKTRVSNSDDASDDEPNTKAMPTYFRPLLYFLFLLFLLFPYAPFY